MEYHQNEIINSLKVFIKNSGGITCSDIFSVIFNLIFWLFLILIILNGAGELSIDVKVFCLFLILGVISYIIYVYLEFHSTTFTYLRTKGDKIIKEKIGDFFQTEPSLYLHIQCYHNERQYDERGRKVNLIVYTHNKKSKYHYKFCRDISGKIV